jgi:hypothetical protein
MERPLSPENVPSNPIKLVAIDLDFTLLTAERTPHAEGAKAIQIALQNGILVVPASGRNYASIQPFANQLGLGPGAVASNGGHVVGLDGAELRYTQLDQSVLHAVLDFATQHRLYTKLYTRSGVHSLYENEFAQLYRSRAKHVFPQPISLEEAKSIAVAKLMMVDSPARLATIRPDAEQLFAPELAEWVASEPEYLEVLPANVDKGSGLALLAQSLNIQNAQIAAIGDYDNDIQMVRWAGFGAAVANASPGLLQVAKHVFSSNEEGGVSEFLTWIVHNNETYAASSRLRD